MIDNIITEDIIIQPGDLDKNIKEFLLEQLNINKEKLHSNENGYIINFKKIISYTNKISHITGNIIFTTKAVASVVKPSKGTILNANVTMLINHGILCQYKNIKIWIPSDKMNGYKFAHGIYNKGKDVIKKDDEIQVNILETRYEDHKFSCIALLT